MSDIDSASGALQSAAKALTKLKALEDAADIKSAILELAKGFDNLVLVERDCQKEAAARTDKLLEAVHALTNATKEAAAQAKKNDVDARKFAKMQAHATAFAPLKAKHMHHRTTEEDEFIVDMASLYGFVPPDNKISNKGQAEACMRALSYLTSGRTYDNKSWMSLSVQM